MLSVEQLKPIYDFLSDLDVCKRCILRFSCVSLHDSFLYKYPEKFEEKYVLRVPKNEEEKAAKKSKKNICPVCINILTEECLDNIVSQIDKNKADEYISKDFHITISIPRTCLIRLHSMCLHLKEHFPEFEQSSVVQLQKIMKFLIADKIEAKIRKEFSSISLLELSIEYGYENDHDDVKNVKYLDKSKFAARENHNEQQRLVSRNIIQMMLEKCDEKLFRANFPVPPVSPSKEAHLINDEWRAAPLFLGGRYFKFERNISQSPWVVEGQLLAPLSVTDIVFDAICKYLSYKKSELTFTASGREDADVRMLGSGRPFYVKVDNPKNREISKETFNAIEREVIKDGQVAVVNLQTVLMADTVQIKKGEDSKTKVYKALCHTLSPDIDEVIKMINSLISSPMKIAQKTPLRVIHRRAVSLRLKTIYKLSATKVEGHENLFKIDVETEAGTYVKEFVNGDLGRTVPSLTSLIGHTTDLVALDVVDVKLEWPPKYSEETVIKTEVNEDE